MEEEHSFQSVPENGSKVTFRDMSMILYIQGTYCCRKRNVNVLLIVRRFSINATVKPIASNC